LRSIVSLPFELPDEIGRLVHGVNCARVGLGCSSAAVYRFDNGLYLKTVVRSIEDEVFGTLEGEARRLEALKERVPVPQLRLFVQDNSRDYLLMTELVGEHAAAKVTHGEVSGAVAAVAAGCRLFHHAEVQGFPIVEDVSTLLEQAKRRVELGLVDTADLDEERVGRSPEDLLEELFRVAPAGNDAVLTHGDLCLPNVIVHGSELVGFVDVGRAAVSDRWRDLALCMRSVEANWGRKWCSELLRLCGVERHEGKLHFYTLLDEFF